MKDLMRWAVANNRWCWSPYREVTKVVRGKVVVEHRFELHGYLFVPERMAGAFVDNAPPRNRVKFLQYDSNNNPAVVPYEALKLMQDILDLPPEKKHGLRPGDNVVIRNHVLFKDGQPAVVERVKPDGRVRVEVGSRFLDINSRFLVAVSKTLC